MQAQFQTNDRPILFGLGQIITIKKTGVRGVIFEVDDQFRGQEDWFQSLELSPRLRSRPWYRIFLDRGEEPVYIVESHLEVSEDLSPIENQNIFDVFSEFKQGRYYRDLH